MSIVKFANAATAVFLSSLIYLTAQAADLSISGTPPATVVAGERYRFLPVVENAARSQLEFNYINKPDWSRHYRSSGLIMGTPAAPGVYAGIQIGVWDGVHYAVMPPFTITVLAAGSGASPAPLEISGTPATSAELGQPYSFKPSVVAPPGAALTFTIAGKPAWAQFSGSTGTLSGTPPEGSAPVYAGIVITVSDGTASAALPAFTLDVFAPTSTASLGTADVTWQRPQVNSNGSPLTNLAGYVIRYGTSASALTKQITVNSASATELQIDNLQAGMWYFAIAAINTAQVVSQFTQVISGKIE